jgi:hypothetical protein
MVMRALAWLTAACLALGCGSRGGRDAQPRTLVLRGFHLVDVASRSVREGDVLIENGVVVERATLPSTQVVEGHGAYLMPALWDLKASLWGNDSALSYEVLDQQANFTQCLAMHLYYGVAHVGVFAMNRDWVERELKRADALELAAAESLYPDRVMCAKQAHGCDIVADLAGAHAALAERVLHHAPLIYVAFAQERKGSMPGVTREVLAEVLAGATKQRIPTVVVVGDWSKAEEAVQLGAKVIYGFPEGPMPAGLLELMQSRGVAFAPALVRYLELDRLLGNEPALMDPFLAPTLQPAVRDTYRREQNLWSGWRPELVDGRARRASMLETVQRAVKAGVPVVAVSDAGWVAGAFQGYGSHANQAWFERAGLDGWSRLAAATVWPAAVLGRHVGFDAGEAADFLALAADPLEKAQNLREIVWVMRKGELVNRAKLLPDLTRDVYRP